MNENQPPEPLTTDVKKAVGVPSALEALEPVITRLLSTIRGAAAAAEVLLLFGDPADGEEVRTLFEATALNGDITPVPTGVPTWDALREDFPDIGPTLVTLTDAYTAIWDAAGFGSRTEALWVPLVLDEHFLGGLLLTGGGTAQPLSATAAIEVRTAAEHLTGLLNQVIRLERENEKLVQLIRMLQVTRTLMRESEAGHLVNMILNTLSRIVGNSRLALFPTTVLGEPRTFIRHVEPADAAGLHELVLNHLNPRLEDRVLGRQVCRETSQAFPEKTFASFTRFTPWILRDAGRTYLGTLYLYDNDPAQEDTLGHAVIRTIVVELERTLRRYLIEDEAAHAITELPYRIWSREYWLRRFEEEIGLTGRRGTRVTCGIVELLDYDSLQAEMDELILKESILTMIQVIKSSVRETDLICRLDRNHFGILFLDAAKMKVMPALERIASQIQRVVGGVAMAPRISFTAGLSEFPWDGEGVPALMRRAWTATAMARNQGPFTVAVYEHEEARVFLDAHQEIREEITVHMELLGTLDLPSTTGEPTGEEATER